MSFSGHNRRFRAFLNEADLYDYAVKALGRRMRTEAELRRLMQTRVEPGDHGATIVDAVITRLREYGYLDDAAYAETFARLRQENEKLGARTVRQKLAQKGVSHALVEEAVETRYAGVNEETLARQYVERKRQRKPEDERDTARIMRRLVAAGFSTGVIYKILRQWDVPEEALTVLDDLEDESHGA